MITVSYTYSFNYAFVGDTSHPVLAIQLSSLASDRKLDTDAYLDSGAQRSLFDGWIAAALGLDLFAGPAIKYVSTSGTEIVARLHNVRLFRPDLGDYELEIGFSLDRIARNLLGRDFFAKLQIGFREQHLRFFIEPQP